MWWNSLVKQKTTQVRKPFCKRIWITRVIGLRATYDGQIFWIANVWFISVTPIATNAFIPVYTYPDVNGVSLRTLLPTIAKQDATNVSLSSGTTFPIPSSPNPPNGPAAHESACYASRGLQDNPQLSSLRCWGGAGSSPLPRIWFVRGASVRSMWGRLLVGWLIRKGFGLSLSLISSRITINISFV